MTLTLTFCPQNLISSFASNSIKVAILVKFPEAAYEQTDGYTDRLKPENIMDPPYLWCMEA